MYNFEFSNLASLTATVVSLSLYMQTKVQFPFTCLAVRHHSKTLTKLFKLSLQQTDTDKTDNWREIFIYLVFNFHVLISCGGLVKALCAASR